VPEIGRAAWSIAAVRAIPLRMVARARLEALTLAALRIVAGTLFAFHGAQKLLGLFATHPQPEVMSQLWIGGVIELVGGVLIAIGLFARPAALVCAGTMAVAYVQFHWKLQLGRELLPIVNRGESAVIYCFVFLMFAARGAGAASLDRLRGLG
jgi:putative oxidoreductase